jgi:hypothetical protein
MRAAEPMFASPPSNAYGTPVVEPTDRRLTRRIVRVRSRYSNSPHRAQTSRSHRSTGSDPVKMVWWYTTWR